MAECTTCSHKKVCKYAEQYVSAGIKVKETVHECVDYAPTAEWIDVKDGLPKKIGRYIVHTRNLTGYAPLEHNVFVAKSIFDDFAIKYWEDNEVTHWMPLPEPPKGVSDNG